MNEGTINGEAQISVTHVARQMGGKEETLIKKEDVEMAETNSGEIEKQEADASEAQKVLPENPATVSVGKKLTLNIGNFESVSVSVHLSMPCMPEKGAVNTMFEKINTWVDRRIEAERNSVRRAQGEGN